MALADWLRRCGLIAILRGVRPDEVLDIAAALEAEGIAVVEVPLNSPSPIESIRRLADACGDRLLIGAGTVMTPAQVAEIAAAGGKLIVTPHANPDIVRAAKSHDLIAVPGFFTPAEAFVMLAAGADALKLFPPRLPARPCCDRCAPCCRRRPRFFPSAASTPRTCPPGLTPEPRASASDRPSIAPATCRRPLPRKPARWSTPSPPSSIAMFRRVGFTRSDVAPRAIPLAVQSKSGIHAL